MLQKSQGSNEPAIKGTTTARFIKFINELLDIIDLDELARSLFCHGQMRNPQSKTNDKATLLI
jgi:hypothetical protein